MICVLLQSYCKSLVVNRSIWRVFWNSHLNCLSTRYDLTTFSIIKYKYLFHLEIERLRECNRALFRFYQFSCLKIKKCQQIYSKFEDLAGEPQNWKSKLIPSIFDLDLFRLWINLWTTWKFVDNMKQSLLIEAKKNQRNLIDIYIWRDSPRISNLTSFGSPS